MDGVTSEDWIDNARMIVDSARAIVPADGALDRIRATRFKEPGFDRAVMAEAGELGLFLMRVPEEDGGLGLGMREVCELARVLGGGLLPEPVLPAMMAASLLGPDLPEESMTGALVLTLAWQDATGDLGWQGGAADGRLSGRKVAVPGAEGAHLFAVTTSQGVALLPRDTVTITSANTLDGGKSSAITFDARADLIPCDHIQAVLQDASLAQSAYLLGLSERALDITLDYLRIRTQFDRPIGSFQALQHRATGMKISLELSRAAIFATARRFDTGADAMARARGAARCKLRAAELAMLVSREAVQMHGAMGITDEADIGLFIRKAMTEANVFGTPRALRAQLAQILDQ
ncbi:acyl-CoA dehydrogenase family protein [Paracoccus saliphilus]|uniref:Acyl-CoA dehydrogenase n=1 Tax=Paracoccus saliphilus TaxID=405559 RepID=A0AA46A6J7_9RHOB|nr:acyl-CoA dehydrogenase family protein [Paracoccus saliphilus]WCR01536.1 acyl-CoA/acyl-ACP dehydrogenase [Paracoccus saliphilus]SIS99152.1 Acyl-CoA dehydrogenase [Paracoccus saliphilus]